MQRYRSIGDLLSHPSRQPISHSACTVAGKRKGYPDLPIEPSAAMGRGVHRISPLMEARHSAAPTTVVTDANSNNPCDSSANTDAKSRVVMALPIIADSRLVT
jgi:hypothetical protein